MLQSACSQRNKHHIVWLSDIKSYFAPSSYYTSFVMYR